MESRNRLSRSLISSGTTLAIGSLVLAGFQMWLSAADVREHRSLSSSFLRDAQVERVTLSEWEPPSTSLSWAALGGGFALILTGIRQSPDLVPTLKARRADDLS